MLVLDANILMRAVLGKRARALIANYAARIEFAPPDIAFAEKDWPIPLLRLRRADLDHGPVELPLVSAPL